MEHMAAHKSGTSRGKQCIGRPQRSTSASAATKHALPGGAATRSDPGAHTHIQPLGCVRRRCPVLQPTADACYGRCYFVLRAMPPHISLLLPRGAGPAPLIRWPALASSQARAAGLPR